MRLILAQLTTVRIHFQVHILNVLVKSLFEAETFVAHIAGEAAARRVTRAKVSEMLFQVFDNFAALGALFGLHKVALPVDFVFVFRVGRVVANVALMHVGAVRVFFVHT